MDNKSDIGYLIVNVSTARGAIPLRDAAVTVYFDEEGNTNVARVLTTDMSGKTEKAELPAPNRLESESPGASKPYATYTVNVTKDGYYPVTNTGVPVFAGVTSIQPVEMIPLAEYNSGEVYPRFGLDVTESSDPNL